MKRKVSWPNANSTCALAPRQEDCAADLHQVFLFLAIQTHNLSLHYPPFTSPCLAQRSATSPCRPGSVGTHCRRPLRNDFFMSRAPDLAAKSPNRSTPGTPRKAM